MQETSEPATKTKIGLIGGLAFRAGVFYYEEILKRYAAENRKLELILSHADVNTVLAYVSSGEKLGLGSYLGSVANELFNGGADLVAVTAVAPHVAIHEISRAARGPVVNVLDYVLPGLKAAGLERVAVLGNRAVMETDMFGTLPEQMVARPLPDTIDKVHTVYNDIALQGKRGTQPEVQYLASVADGLISLGGAQVILLAGTDLSSFYAEQPPTYPFLDVARLHIDAIMRRARAT